MVFQLTEREFMQIDYFIAMALSLLFELLKSVVKNPQSKANMKKALLKLFIAIRSAYANDPDFS
jgi:hypothetical protein